MKLRNILVSTLPAALPPDVPQVSDLRAGESIDTGLRPSQSGHSPSLHPDTAEGHRPSAHQAAKPRRVGSLISGSLLTIPLFLALAFVIIANAQQPQGQSPGQSRGSRTPDEYIKLLESERRISELQVTKVVETLKVKPGQHIADIGSGSGLFTRPLAKQAGAKGVVYAVDIDPELLKYVEKIAAEQKLTNIKTILGGEADPKLPEKVDLIVIIDTLHHIGNQPTYLKGLKRYLKPNGRIAVIDFSKTWPTGHEKMVYKVEDLDGWMKGAGFKRVEQYDFLDNDFFVIYQ